MELRQGLRRSLFLPAATRRLASARNRAGGLGGSSCCRLQGSCQDVRKLPITSTNTMWRRNYTHLSSTYLHFLALALIWEDSFPSLTWLDIQAYIDPTQTLAVPILALALTQSVPQLQWLSLVDYRHDVLAFDAWANMLEMRQERARRRECRCELLMSEGCPGWKREQRLARTLLSVLRTQNGLWQCRK